MSRSRRTKGAGNVRKLASGRYQARFVGPDGQRHTAPTTFDTRMDAVAWCNAQKAAVDNEIWSPPVKTATATGVTLNAYFDQWISLQDHLRTRTREEYLGSWRRHVRANLGTRPLVSIDEATVRGWRQGLNPKTLTARKHAYSLVKQVMAAAVRDRLIVVNPVETRPESSEGGRKPVILTPAEIAEMTALLPERYRGKFLVAVWCGLRFGETAALQRRDIDLDAGVVSVTKNAVRAKSGVYVGPPKTPAGTRDVTIPRHIIEPLREHLDLFVDPEPAALVFPGVNGRPIAPSSVAKVFKPAAAKLGHPEMVWHDLRHTSGTLATQSGGTLREVQARLGHSTPAAAMRYQHAVDSRQTVIADNLAALAAQ